MELTPPAPGTCSACESALDRTAMWAPKGIVEVATFQSST